MSTAIKIRGLNKFYGKKQALKDVNLTIRTGMFGLLGRNGALYAGGMWSVPRV